MDKNAKIYVAGHKGLVGSAICRVLKKKGYENLVFKTHKELELTAQKAVADFFQEEQPDYVFLAAAKVGGIMANNTYRADFIYDNIQVQSNVIHQSFKCGVTKLLFLGSTCIYPKECPQPMKEEYLLTSPLEYTNEPYATAKIAGIKMCESYNLQYGTNFLSVMPTNLYGPGDNFNLEKAHVLPAMLRKMHLALLLEQNRWDDVLADLKMDSTEDARQTLDKFGISAHSVEIWGTGRPMREFLWSKDMADACVFIMENVDFTDLTKGMKEIRNTHINIGSGREISIKDLALAVKNVVGFQGNLVFNSDKPDGTLRKLTDVSKLESLGWKYDTSLDQGLRMLYDWYLNTNKRT